MPNRLIPDFSRDEKFNKLSLLAESFFRRLWNKADDFGRYDARPLILKADLFPLRDVRIPDIVRSLKECETADLLVCYQAENGEYLQLKNFNQRVRAMKSIYPPMPDSCQTDVRQMSDNRLLEEEVEVEEETKGDKSPVLDFNSILSFSDSKAFTNAWKKWLAYRSERKLAKWTESTLVAKAKIFEKWGEAKTIQSIEQSIANGWQGLFEPKGDNPKEPISLEDFRKAYRVSNFDDFNADFCPDMPHHRAVLNADLETLKTKFKSDYDYIVADWTRDFSRLKKAVKEGRDRI